MTAFTLYASSVPVTNSRPKSVRASYDAAQTTRENRRHWANADSLAAVAALTPAVRRTLRARARYEVQNDGYASGLVKDLAADVVGSGPSLLCQLENDRDNRTIEDAWHEWCDAINFYDKLRILEESRVTDGETFLLAVTNRDIENDTGITLDLIDYESDQIADPTGTARFLDPLSDDGIKINSLNYPVSYTFLDRHPGDFRGFNQSSRVIAADQVIHWYRKIRPGHIRGVTDMTTALPILPLLRRYTMATVTAAEVAARFAVLLQSKLSVPDADEESAAGEFEEFDLPQIGGMTLPSGYEAVQMKPEHPTSNFGQFDDSIVRRVGRGTQMPFGGTAGDHSKYNYSSARLELWFRNRRRSIVRDQLRIRVLDDAFKKWFQECRLARRFESRIANLAKVKHVWQYEAEPSLDPSKDAQADDSRLRNGTATLEEVLGARGVDWRESIRKSAEIANECERLGMKGLAEIIRGNVPAGQPVPIPPEASTP